jgi:uncharacterized protein YjbI with pentapeptide repeats
LADFPDEKRDLPVTVPAGGTVFGSTEFRPRSDLTYRTFEGLRASSLSLEQSLLTGSLLRSCHFDHVDFRRCDLDGMRIERTAFVGCDFSNVDVRSSALIDCTFTGCSFEEALITDCTFAATLLSGASFAHAAVSDCSFSECALKACDIARSSFVQNRFVGSRVEQMALADCTFSYNVMKTCEFQDVKINAESLGLVYGLTLDNVIGMGLIHLGADENLDVTADVIPSLVDTYRLRRWHLGVAVMRLNFGLTSNVYALSEYLNTVREVGHTGGIIKRDELRFLGTILSDLEKSERLPLMSWIAATELIAELADGIGRSSPESDHAGESLRALAGRLYSTGAEALGRFDQQRLQLASADRDETVRLVLRFEHRPEISLWEMLNMASAMSGFPVAHESELLDQRSGSYVEVVRTTLLSAAALQMFLFLLNGCVVQLTELRARTAALTRKKIPQPYALLATQQRQQLPPFLSAAIHALAGKMGLVKWLVDPKLKGYSPTNLLDGKLTDDSKSTTTDD